MRHKFVQHIVLLASLRLRTLFKQLFPFVGPFCPPKEIPHHCNLFVVRRLEIVCPKCLQTKRSPVADRMHKLV